MCQPVYTGGTKKLGMSNPLMAVKQCKKTNTTCYWLKYNWKEISDGQCKWHAFLQCNN